MKSLLLVGWFIGNTSILPNFQTEDGSVDLGGLVAMVLSILAGLIVVAGTIGIIICGVMWMTARDDERQVVLAKKRISEIVVGIAAFVLLSLLGNIFIPRSPNDINKTLDGETWIEKIKKPEEKTDDSTTDTSEVKTTKKPVTPLSQDSSSIPCASGTKDLGTTNEAYYQGKKITIRLCSVSTITSTSAEDSDGYAHVNSRVSGAYYALGKKYKELYGSKLNVTQSFRTMAKQQYFYNCYKTKKCNNGNLAAEPGYSNHQLGTALDFSMHGSGWGKTGVSGFFNKYLSSYGLVRNVSSEDWHVNPIE